MKGGTIYLPLECIYFNVCICIVSTHRCKSLELRFEVFKELMIVIHLQKAAAAHRGALVLIQ